MPALPELQRHFSDAIFAGAEDALLACIVERGERGRRRIAAYRRSILGNLVGALLATYPVLARIVGEPFFRAAARAYVDAHPSRSGDLNEYGGEFAVFIAAWPPARQLGYLADVARLECLVQEAYYAADAATDLAALAACSPLRYGALRFALAPACARIDSPWPLDEIWRVNAEDYAGEMAVDFAHGARLLVLRREGRAHVESLSDGEAAFLDALAAGDALATAAATAAAGDPGFDLGAGLARFVGNDAIVRASLPADDAGGQA